MKKFGIALVLMSFLFDRSAMPVAAEYSPRAVHSLDGKVSCFVRNKGFFSTTVGPCDGFIPPRRIAIGETFTANGKERTIGVLKAIQADDDWKYDNIDMKKGEWSCAAAEGESNLEDNDQDALWLSIMKCQPIN